MGKLANTIVKYVPNIVSEKDTQHKNIKYKMYWLLKKPHCDKNERVLQVDGRFAYVCKHEIN